MFRSLGEMHGTPGFQERLEREFPQGAAELERSETGAEGEDDSELSRRRFMRLMGASTALAGLGMAACRRPVGTILPYAGNVEWMVPGKAIYYATAMPRLGGATPLIATIHEGRPTHLQGNPLHPSNANGGSGTDHFAIASILDLYDPDRARDFKKDGATISAEDFGGFFAAKKKELHASNGKGLAILHGAGTSPTRDRVATEVRATLANTKFFEYETLDRGNMDAAAAELLGEGKRPLYRFEKATRILSIGCDFLGLDRVADNATGDFSKGRKLEGDDKAAEMNRLYVLEHQFTLTGGAADHRLPVKVSDLAGAVAAIAAKIGALTGDAALKVADASASTVDPKWIDAVAEDLFAARGKGLVVAGPRLAKELHQVVIAINSALTNVGADKPMDVIDSGAMTSDGGIADLAKAIEAGDISTLVITAESDPVYSAPADLKFGDLVAKVETVIYNGVRSMCATADAAGWQVPGAHFLESWGDVRASDGTYSVIQPMIAPLYGGISEVGLLLDLVAKEDAAANGGDPVMAAVKETFGGLPGASDAAWNTTLRNGFLKTGGAASAASIPSSKVAASAIAGLRGDAGDKGSEGEAGDAGPALSAEEAAKTEVVFTADNKVWDGRHINNGWLQELPDPITSLVWDNAALVSIKTLKALGLSKKDLKPNSKTGAARLLKVTVGESSAYFPILAAPGQAVGSVSISVGYGQQDAGYIAGTPQSKGTSLGDVTGFDVSPLRTSAAPYVAKEATIEVVTEKVALREGLETKTYPLAQTQEHFAMEGRALYRDGTKKEFDEEIAHYDPEHGSSFQKRGMDSHIPIEKAVYRGQDLNPDGHPLHQWGLAIDLNQCIGCTACTVACQSENNIPIVGKDQVIIGREMHWIRMDRYFAPATEKDDHGHYHTVDEDLENPQMMPQPVACAQCEAAPCETVCPVNATVHTEEGLNAMAYNRCIGTRYCANNCPYKARRFNFFDYNNRPTDELYKGPLTSKEKTGVAPSLQLQKNPNVTVRMRGVMEKCTYCVQRLQEAKIKQKQVARDSSNTRIPTDSVKVACQQACPADAISFGDLANKESMVNKVKASPRNYEMLKYLGLGSRTTYLARIKNPNMNVPGAEQIGEVSGKIH